MKWLKTILVSLIVLPVPAAYADTPDPLIEGAKLCTRHLPRFEREYAIPTHLLSAIATTESGRYHEGLGMKLPWPWAINANGKSYFFDSKEEAIAAVQGLRRHGVQSIDVGCMQVNLHHHPDAFSSLSDAFEPRKNIAYAASFLNDLHSEGGTWKKAAAEYHSRTPSLGREYVNQVYGSWYAIIDKLRAARASLPERSAVALNEVSKPAYLSSPAPLKQAQAMETERVHMNSIRVSSESKEQAPQNTRLASNIMVVRSDLVPASAAASTPVKPGASAPVAAKAPETKASEITTADSTPLQTPMPTPAQTLAVNPVTGHASDADVLNAVNPSAGRRSLETSSAHRTGPNFIFND